jgi:hypothetical protein
VAALAEWLVGPIHHRVIVTGEPVDDTFLDAVVDIVLTVSASSHKKVSPNPERTN